MITILKIYLKTNYLHPYVGLGLSYLKFDSKGSYDNTNNEYEVDLLSQWLLDPINTEPYSQNAVDIPLSIGLNLKLTIDLTLKLEHLIIILIQIILIIF